jgi:3-ketosteroid 9alpha-monooxygenase subunit B
MSAVEQFEVTVADVIRETADTVTLRLAADRPPSYRAGQYLTIDPLQFAGLRPFGEYLQAQKGKGELVRAYSLSSAPHEPQLAFTVKQEPFTVGEQAYPPLLSPFLVHHAHVGMRLVISGFAGGYVLPAELEARADTVLHLVAGSGAVPNFSILKDALHRGLPQRHLFVDANRTHADILFREATEELAAAHDGKFSVLHLLTRDPAAATHGAQFQHGRLTPELLRALVPDPARTEVFVCGPGVTMLQRKAALSRGEKPTPRFLENAVELLKGLGIPRKQLHQESYG